MPVAGLYVKSGLKLRIIPDLSGGGNMRTEMQPAHEYFLLASDGRAHRDSGWGVVAATHVDAFDFAAAAEQDPDSVGNWTHEGEQVRITLPGQVIDAVLGPDGALLVGEDTFVRTGADL